jgi:MarR family transcriptional regulator, 2-MHQ and catechol-resistance regulon repressor
MMLDDRRDAFYEAQFNGFRALYPPADLQAARVIVELLLTCDVIDQSVGRVLASFGLSRSTFNILMLLRHGPSEGMQLHDLGELLLVSRANVTGLINHLEDKGLVTREVPASDRRVRHARLTPKAEAVLEQCLPAHLENIHHLLGDVADSEKLSILTHLRNVRVSIRRHAAADSAVVRKTKRKHSLTSKDPRE